MPARRTLALSPGLTAWWRRRRRAAWGSPTAGPPSTGLCSTRTPSKGLSSLCPCNSRMARRPCAGAVPEAGAPGGARQDLAAQAGGGGPGPAAGRGPVAAAAAGEGAEAAGAGAALGARGARAAPSTCLHPLGGASVWVRPQPRAPSPSTALSIEQPASACCCAVGAGRAGARAARGAGGGGAAAGRPGRQRGAGGGADAAAPGAGRGEASAAVGHELSTPLFKYHNAGKPQSASSASLAAAWPLPHRRSTA